MRRAGLPLRPRASAGLVAALLLAAGLLLPAHAQSTLPGASTAANESAPAPSPKPSGHKASTQASGSATTAAQTAAALARVTEENQELLDLLKKQQAVLEDIQYDRRLQNRQVSSLEDRLEITLQQNTELQTKIAKLEDQISAGPAPAVAPSVAAGATHTAPARAPTPAPEPPPPSKPVSYLPPPETEGAPGTKSWQRLFTLSGTDGKSSDTFHIEGRQWRVVWHNQDQPGDAYVNTSALFINAFPKDDTVPQKVCSKLGSGGDSTELNGPGDFYLKVEASGGSWELAVEDFK